jgi:hypothetical protein
VGQGDLDVELNITRKDESGELARKVADRTHELDELKRTLEQRVNQEIVERKKAGNAAHPTIPARSHGPYGGKGDPDHAAHVIHD